MANTSRKSRFSTALSAHWMPSSNKVRKVTSENYPTDAGREGELIFRLVYQQAGCKKPFSRLWLSSMEETAIREGFQKLNPKHETISARFSVQRTHHDAAFLPEPNQPRLSDAGVMKISKKATTIAIVNQKGGTGKTTTCENLGIGLAMEGKKVLLVDADPQGSLTISMGWQQPDELPTTLSTLMAKAMNDQSIPPGEGILHHAEGIDLIPANIELAGLEVSLVNCMNREKMLKQVLEGAKHEYDFILLDCTPSLGMLTVNALAAADTTLIPVQAQYLSAKGLEQLLQTVQKVRRQINPKLKIEGILLTMTDSRTNYGQQIDNLIRGAYGSKIKVFDQTIPRSVRAAEISAVGKSIFQHDPKGKVAEAYKSLTEEVMANAEKQLKRVAERGR